MRARAPAQNKLHRNAGPEDLAATEAMLARVTAPGAAFAPAFVAEFRTFTAELRDFFNAGAFADMLALLRPSLPDDALQARARPRAGRPAIGLAALAHVAPMYLLLKAKLRQEPCAARSIWQSCRRRDPAEPGA